MRRRAELSSPSRRPKRSRTTSWTPRATSAVCRDRSLGTRRGERVVQGFGSDLDPLRHREHDLALVVQEPFRVDDRYADQAPLRIEAKRMAFRAGVEIHGTAGV